MRKNSFLLGLGIVAIALAASISLYARLPEQLPAHWNIHGEVDGYMGKAAGAFLMPAIMLLMLGLAKVLPWLSPKRFEVETFQETYEFVMLLLVTLLAFFHTIILWAALAGSVAVGRALAAGFFLFFAVLGNVLGRVRRNFWIGIRVPWTLANEQVWNDTHRFAARLYFFGGVAGFAATLMGLPLLLAFAWLVIAALLPVGFSLMEYKQLERQGRI